MRERSIEGPAYSLLETLRRPAKRVHSRGNGRGRVVSAGLQIRTIQAAQTMFRNARKGQVAFIAL